MRINKAIRIRKIFVIDEFNINLGIMSPEEALRLAEEKNLDLVEVNPKATPPVCKFLDYGKFLYEKKKQKKHQPRQTTKEIRIRPGIGSHDLETKMRHGRRFIEKGHKIMLTMTLKGRERAFAQKALEMLLSIANTLEDIAKVESSPKLAQNKISMLMAPV